MNVDHGRLPIAERLAELRKKRGLNMRELAKASGASTSLISQVETGKTNPTVGKLQDIATALVAPLLAADPRGDLVRTLRCYLDHESNTTTTAAVLGLHRNTVLQRLARIRALLRADLNRAEERLAVHLAVHAVTVR